VASGRFWIGVLIVLGLGATMLVLSMSRNGGCLPWQERVGIRSDTFSEMRGITRCK
jgi:hypothetical protein